jgi:hypothetical protein
LSGVDRFMSGHMSYHSRQNYVWVDNGRSDSKACRLQRADETF